MASIGTALAKNEVKEGFDNMKGNLSGKKGPAVDWADYNWPPLIKVLHFRLDELDS